MDITVTAERSVARRRSSKRGRFVLAVAAALVIAGAPVLYQFLRPQYRQVTSEPVGPEHKSLVVSYPADWEVSHHVDAMTDERESDTPVTYMSFDRMPAVGPQRWIEHFIYRLNEQDLTSLGISLQRVDAVEDLDSETRRLVEVYGQIAGPGGDVKVTRASSPLGPAVHVEVYSPRTGDTRYYGVVVLYPTPEPGGIRYEVNLNYRASERMRSRMRQVALDVVSRLRLV